MTNLVDFDRSLAEFLDDGPSTAPEAPVIAALAHARTAPRRPDPLRRFRPDVMAQRAGRPLGLRPALLVGLLALLAAGIGVAVIGSRPPDSSVLVPPSPGPATPSAVPSAPSPSAGPSESPTTAGSPEPLGPPAVPPIRVALVGAGNAATVDVVDESGLLTAAVSGPAGEGASVEGFDAANDTPTTLRLTWLGSPCDTVHRLTIDASLTSLILDLPNCLGDAIGVDRSVLLTFSRPVDATTLTTTMRHGVGGVDMPNWTTTAPDSVGNRYDLVLVDPGYLVDTLSGSYDPEVEAVGAGPTAIRLIQTDATTIRLIWLGAACATIPVLAVDPSGDRWQLTDAPCSTSAADVLRMIDVTLRTPRSVDSISVAHAAATP